MSTDRSETLDDLIARARDRAEAAPVDESWGYRIQLDEDDSFTGRYRGKTLDTKHDRDVFLFWDDDGELCWSRFYAALGRELEQAAPQVGDRVAIVRGKDYSTADGNSGFSFGVVTEPSSEPLPAGSVPVVDEGDDLPF